MTTNKPTILLVLGMHRSGTSLVAQMAAKWGAYMGNDLIPASESNEDGHWEYTPLVSLNEKMLAFTDNYWYAPPLSVNVSILMDYFEKEARQLVAEMDQNETIWCWKDPRMIIFLPFWRKILSDRKLIFVVSFRDPLSVVSSLKIRNNISHISAISLWEYETRKMLEELSPDDNCFFLEYEKLVENPKETCHSLFSFLNHSSNLKQGIEKYEAMLNVVKPNLRHSKPESNINLDSFQESLSKLLKNDNPIENYNKDVTRIQFVHDILDVNKKENFYELLQLQLFISSNRNSYTEQNSIVNRFDWNSHQIVFDVSGYTNITSLRIDPLDEWTSLSFRKMELYSNDLLLGVITEYESNAIEIIDGILFFTTVDPQIAIDLNEYRDFEISKVIFYIDYHLVGIECKAFFAENIGLFLKKISKNVGVCDLSDNSFQAQYTHLLQIINGLKESLSECNSELYSKEEILNDNRTEINKLSEELKSKELIIFNSYELINKLEVENSNECKKVEKLEEELNFINESIQAKDAEIKLINMQKQQELDLLYETINAKDQEIEAIKKLNEQELKQTNSALKMLMDNERKKLIELHKKHLLGRLAGNFLQFCKHPFVYLRNRRNLLEVYHSGLFDDSYYLEQNPDLYLTTVDLLKHYMQYGWKEGRNPNALFDTKFYLENNQDVKEVGVNPLLHFVLHGWKEGRKPNVFFDVTYYLETYQDIKDSGVNPLYHFKDYGWKEFRNPHPLFDLKFYFESNPELKDTGINPLIHFLQNNNVGNNVETYVHDGDIKIIDKSGLFDRDYYLYKYRDVEDSGIDPIGHFVNDGWKEFRNPSKEFDTKFYLKKYPDVALLGVNPLIHYIIYGRIEGRLPYEGFLFDNIRELLSEKREKTFVEKIDIIIPVYNGFEFLQRLFDSINKNTTKGIYRLIVIDDCSTDTRVKDFLEQQTLHFSNMLLIHNSENIGFVKTVNKAVRYALNNFVILNTDVFVPEKWLERLMMPLCDNEYIATTTPFSNAATILSFPETCIDNAIIDFDAILFDSAFSKLNYDSGDSRLDLPTGIGFCMGVRKSVWDKLGGFNEELFSLGYGEENDFCQRIIRLGYRNIFVPNLFVYHKHGGSFDQVKKEKLLEKNLKTINQLYPNYSSDVAAWVKNDPTLNYRTAVLLILLGLSKDSTLIFDHGIGGGAGEYLNKSLLPIIDSSIIAICTPKNENFELNILLKNNTFTISTKISFSNILDIEPFFPENIIINQLACYELSSLKKLLSALSRSKAKITHLFHDYYPVCPSLNLLTRKGEFCKLSCLNNNLIRCLNENPYKYVDFNDFTLWRKCWQDYFNNTFQIKFFSNASKNIASHFFNFNEESVVITPHVLHTFFSSKNSYLKKENNEIIVGVIGAVAIHKGFNILIKMAEVAKERKLKIRFIIIGESANHYKNVLMQYDNIKITGAYKPEQLPDILSVNNIDLIALPSIWPETFCYTLQEAMQLNYPVVAFDIGAQGERLRKYHLGKVVQNVDASEMLECIIDLSAKIKTLSSIDIVDNSRVTNNSRLSYIYDNSFLKSNELFVNYQDLSWTCDGNTLPVLIVFDTAYACSIYRGMYLAHSMALNKISVSICQKDDCLQMLKKRKFQTIIFQKIEDIKLIEKIRKITLTEKITLLGEVDDLLFPEFVKTISDGVTDSTQLNELANTIEYLVSNVDRMIVSTPFLKKYIEARYNTPCVVRRNRIPIEFKLFAENKKLKSTNFKILVISGSSSHDKNFKLIEDLLLNLLKENKNIQLSLVGINNANSRLVNLNNVNILPQVSHIDHFKYYAEHDVCLFPLVDSDFNRAKSYLKFIQAGICKCVIIASPLDEFCEIIVNGQNGFLADSEEDWINAIKKCMTAKDSFRNISETAYKDIIENHTTKDIENELLKLIS